MHHLLNKYWILSIRRVVKHQANKCTRWKWRDAKPMSIIMAPLPCHRLTPFKPAFLYTGIDYFGPVTVKMLGRGSRLEKRWICLFTCFWPQELCTSKWPSKRRRLSRLFLEIYESTPASASNIQRQRYQLTSWRTREAVDEWIKKQEDIQINAAH